MLQNVMAFEDKYDTQISIFNVPTYYRICHLFY